jgi:hypothetical protein
MHSYPNNNSYCPAEIGRQRDLSTAFLLACL